MYTGLLSISLGLTLAQTGPAASASSANTSYMVYGFLLIGVGIILLAIELVVPSAGLLALTAAAALVAGVVLVFLGNEVIGLIAAAGTLVAAPFFLGFLIRIWPNTPIARFLSLRSQTREAFEAGQQDAEKGKALIGAKGSAVTELRPVGTCLINGQRMECVAEGGLIPAGTEVVVTAAEGLHVTVRAVE